MGSGDSWLWKQWNYQRFDGQAQFQIMVATYALLLVGKVLHIYIVEDIDETNSRQFFSEFGQQCEDCFVQDWQTGRPP